jgi:NAD(P)-dependent dehydrogenase (short-subunit alcohol dehydrogenase family)
VPESILDMRGRAALVVGGGQGMGRASALLLGRLGAKLCVLDEVAERAEAVAAEARALGAEASAIVADVTDAAEAERAVGEAARFAGGLDTLVNIVGGASWAPLLELEDAVWERDLRLNLTQHWSVGRAAAKRMIAGGRGGSLVVVASVSGMFSAAGHGAYGAAKAGLIALVKTMADEWWPHGIRVNAVVPGAVRTPRIEAAWQSGAIRRPAADVVERMALPEDVAGAIAFLASGLARRITGQTLVLDGGISTRFPFRFEGGDGA